MHNFEFVKPSSIADAVAALANEDAQPISGGQTLIPSMKARLNAPEILVSLTGIAEMAGVRRDGSTMVVGAATTHAAVAREAAADFPGLAALAGLAYWPSRMCPGGGRPHPDRPDPVAQYRWRGLCR